MGGQHPWKGMDGPLVEAGAISWEETEKVEWMQAGSGGVMWGGQGEGKK